MLGPQDLASFGSREYSAAPCRERSRSGACCGTGQERAASRSLRWWHAGRQRVSPVRQRGTLLQAKLTRKTRRIPSGIKGRSRVSPVRGLQKDKPATFADMFPTLSPGIALANNAAPSPPFRPGIRQQEGSSCLGLRHLLQKRAAEGEDKAMSERRTLIQHARFLCDSGPFFCPHIQTCLLSGQCSGRVLALCLRFFLALAIPRENSSAFSRSFE